MASRPRSKDNVYECENGGQRTNDRRSDSLGVTGSGIFGPSISSPNLFFGQPTSRRLYASRYWETPRETTRALQRVSDECALSDTFRGQQADRCERGRRDTWFHRAHDSFEST